MENDRKKSDKRENIHNEIDRRELHKRICTNLAVAIGVVLLVIFVLPKLLRFFFPLIIAWIVAMMANPVIRFLEKRIKLMRKHGTALVIILVLVAMTAAVYGIAALAISQTSSLVKELPEIYTSVAQNLQEVLEKLHSKVHFIPASLQGVFEGQENSINDYITSAMDKLDSDTFSKMGSMASSVIDFIVYAVLTILASYFMTVEKENISSLMKEKTPKGIQEFVIKVKNICVQAIGGYFKAHFKIMVVIFFITVIPFSIMGISYSGLLAVIIAIVDFLPFFGAGTVLGPWAIYELLTGGYQRGIILIVLYLVIMIVRQFLEPKLIGDSIGISAFQILIFMLIGYRIGGMLGLILSIPIGMVILACYREGMFESYIRGLKILAEDINEYRKY